MTIPVSPAVRATPTTPIRDKSIKDNVANYAYANNNNTSSPRTPRSMITNTPLCSPFSGRSFASSFTSPSFAQIVTDGGGALVKQQQQQQHRSPHRNPFYPHTPSPKKSPGSSLADQIDNWRTRARLNGIKVAPDGNRVNSCESVGEERQQSINSPRYKLPLCFSTPPPKRTRENIYSRGAYTAPSKFPDVDRITASPSYFGDEIYNQGLTDLAKFNNLFEALSLSSTAYAPSTPARFQNNDHVTFPSPAPFLPTSDHRLESPIAFPKSSCTVCDKQSSESFRMIVLSPCSHVFCASCFTGTLNIVGEKNMSCMECNTPVESFHFALDVNGHSETDCGYRPRSPSELVAKLMDLTNGVKTAMIPPKPVSRPSAVTLKADVSVLRIDNVPWDVTPSMLKEFFQLSLHSVHILLDLKGKTLSHAFVQLASPDARIALRSTQNAVLGRGRRARAVTVTLASMDELMMAIYHYWRGTFKNGVPSLDGLNSERVKDALTHGLISKEELNSLKELMLDPNSPFLKVPELPFSSLMNILLTFPSDVDSQIFWNLEIRNILYDVTLGKCLFTGFVAIVDPSALVAVKTLIDKVLEMDANVELLLELRDAAVACQVFTELQRLTILQIMKDTGGMLL